MAAPVPSPWFQAHHVGEHAHPATTPATPETCAHLVLETRHQDDKTMRDGHFVLDDDVITADYWSHRVRLSDAQAIVGFPKFDTTGIGFAHQTQHPANLPHTCRAQDIYDHIEHNKADPAISRDDCLTAIRMIQAAIAPT